jgi:hypothetical protein
VNWLHGLKGPKVVKRSDRYFRRVANDEFDVKMHTDEPLSGLGEHMNSSLS